MFRSWGQLSACVLAAAVAGGCSAGPRVELISWMPKRVDKAGRLEAIEFPAVFQATGLEGQQLIYQVQVLDNRSRPLRSRTGSHETKSGGLGASRTLLVFQPRQRSDIVATIPAAAFSVSQERFPLRARIEVSRVTGERLASRLVVLPVSRAEELMPPPATQPAPARLYWFVRSPTSVSFPVLQGPFASREEALAAAPGAVEAPLGVRADEKLWFIPIRNPANPTSVVWSGPFASEQEAGQAIAVLTGCLLHGSGMEAGKPTPWPVEAGLAQRTDLGDVGALCAQSKPE